MSGEPLSPQVLSALLILATIFHAFALILTSFRLWFRYHRRRLWWDDFWAALALLCDAICMVAMWLSTAPLDKPYTNFGAFSTHPQSRNTHIITLWLDILIYTCTIWFARLSIVFSVARIVPSARCATMIVFGTGGMFVCMWVYILACKAIMCSLDKSWYDTVATGAHCRLPNWVAVSEICTDAFSDAILVVLPLRLLWHVKLPSNQKIMVLSVFSTSLLVTVVSVVHTVYLMSHIAFLGGLTANIEGAVSVIVCNLLVIVTFIYRVITNGEDLTAGLSLKNAGSSNHFTTVDLDVSGGSMLTSVGITSGTMSSGTGVSEGAGLVGTQVSSVVFANANYKTSLDYTIPRGGSDSIPLPGIASVDASPRSDNTTR